MNYEQPSVLIKGSIPISGNATDQLFLSNPPEYFISSNKDSANLIKGTPVSTHSSGIGFVRAVNTGLGSSAFGVLAEDAGIGFAKTILLQGVLVLSDWTLITGASSLQARANYYLGSAGLLTVTAPTTPGQISQLIGRATSTVALEIVIDSPILL